MRSPLVAHIPELLDNLQRAYLASTPEDVHNGSVWYPMAQAVVRQWAHAFGQSAETVASAIAAVSPQCDWPSNLRIAAAVLARQSDTGAGGALPVNVRKAERLRDTGGGLVDLDRLFPCGPKVRAFARNLSGDMSAVTIDHHSYEAAFQDATACSSFHPVRYRIVAECYRTVARDRGRSPAELQAILWCSWKRQFPRVVKRQLRRTYE